MGVGEKCLKNIKKRKGGKQYRRRVGEFNHGRQTHWTDEQAATKAFDEDAGFCLFLKTKSFNGGLLAPSRDNKIG